MPVDHKAVPPECDDVMAPPVEHETVPRSGVPSDATSRTPANRGLAGLSDVGLIVLGSNASRRFGAFRSSTRRLSAVVGSERWPAVQLERSAHGASVGALRQNSRGLGNRECKDCGGRDCQCKQSHEFLSKLLTFRVRQFR